MKIKQRAHCGCDCPGCLFLDVYPAMPSLDPPDANAIGHGKDEWTVWCNYLGPLINGKATLVQRGMTTDGGSLPKATWSVMGDPWQMPMAAYFIIHDADYAAELYPRAECDARFLSGMADDGRIGWAKRNAVWAAVRAFGGGVWSAHTAESVAKARALCRVVGEEEYWKLVSAHCVLSV